MKFITKVRIKIMRFLFSDLIADFHECDYELGYEDGYKDGYDAGLKDFYYD